MSVKTTLKTFKLNESFISMVLGAVVIIVAGLLVVNLLSKRQTGSTLPTGEITENTTEKTDDQGTLIRDGKRIHIVQESDNLWKIAEKYYESGYNWVDIAEENKLESSDSLTEGQELIIPSVDSRTKTVASATNTSPTPTVEQRIASSTSEITPTETLTPTLTPKPTTNIVQNTNSDSEEKIKDTDSTNSISGSTYTVEKGDTLWDIAERAYGDPYKWSEIAKANNLVNPNLIHPGNVFTLPR